MQCWCRGLKFTLKNSCLHVQGRLIHKRGIPLFVDTRDYEARDSTGTITTGTIDPGASQLTRLLLTTHTSSITKMIKDRLRLTSNFPNCTSSSSSTSFYCSIAAHRFGKKNILKHFVAWIVIHGTHKYTWHGERKIIHVISLLGTKFRRKV